MKKYIIALLFFFFFQFNFAQGDQVLWNDLTTQIATNISSTGGGSGHPIIQPKGIFSDIGNAFISGANAIGNTFGQAYTGVTNFFSSFTGSSSSLSGSGISINSSGEGYTVNSLSTANRASINNYLTGNLGATLTNSQSISKAYNTFNATSYITPTIGTAINGLVNSAINTTSPNSDGSTYYEIASSLILSGGFGGLSTTKDIIGENGKVFTVNTSVIDLSWNNGIKQLAPSLDKSFRTAFEASSPQAFKSNRYNTDVNADPNIVSLLTTFINAKPANAGSLMNYRNAVVSTGVAIPVTKNPDANSSSFVSLIASRQLFNATNSVSLNMSKIGPSEKGLTVSYQYQYNDIKPEQVSVYTNLGVTKATATFNITDNTSKLEFNNGAWKSALNFGQDSFTNYTLSTNVADGSRPDNSTNYALNIQVNRDGSLESFIYKPIINLTYGPGAGNSINSGVKVISGYNPDGSIKPPTITGSVGSNIANTGWSNLTATFGAKGELIHAANYNGYTYSILNQKVGVEFNGGVSGNHPFAGVKSTLSIDGIASLKDTNGNPSDNLNVQIGGTYSGENGFGGGINFTLSPNPAYNNTPVPYTPGM